MTRDDMQGATPRRRVIRDDGAAPVAPRVSVLMPVYKPDPRYLRAAIESVVRQTFESWEMIIVEEPPADCTRDIVEAVGDERIRHVLRTERTRLCDSLNEGLDLCRADLVARFDADDVMVPERLSMQVAHMDRHPHVVALGTAITVINEKDEVVGRRHPPESAVDVAAAMRRYNPIAHPTVMFRRAVVRAAGSYRPVRAEDYDLWCRLAVAGHAIENLPQELLRYRYHEKSVKATTVHEMIRETIATKRRHFEARFTTGDRMRLFAERVLLLLPARAILWLFRRLEY